MKRYPDFQLTENEYYVMSVLFSSEESFCYADIMEVSKERNWGERTLHGILNSLLEKKLIKVADYKIISRAKTRLYRPAITVSDFNANLIRDNYDKLKQTFNVKNFMSAMVKDDDEQILFEIKEWLEEKMDK